MGELLISQKPCAQCLTSRNRIVSDERAAQIIRDCKSAGTHFQCHKGTACGQTIHCRGVHDRLGSRAYAMAKQFGIPILDVDADDLEPARLTPAGEE